MAMRVSVLGEGSCNGGGSGVSVLLAEAQMRADCEAERRCMAERWCVKDGMRVWCSQQDLHFMKHFEILLRDA